MNFEKKSTNLIIAVGVPGSGKSLILSAAKGRDSSIDVQNYGKAMLRVARKAEIDRDRMRHLSPDEQAALGVSAAEYIMKQGRDSERATTIVDTHALIKSPYGYVPGLPLPVLQVLKPRAICVIEAAPEFVCRCREGDPQRFREKASTCEIRRHQELTRQFAVSCAAASGCVLQLIDNDGRNPDEIVQALLELIEQL